MSCRICDEAIWGWYFSAGAYNICGSCAHLIFEQVLIEEMSEPESLDELYGAVVESIAASHAYDKVGAE